MTVYHLENTDWQERLIVSLYYSIITMITVGYGDIAPSTSVERIYVVLMCFISCGTFGYVINKIGNIF